MTNAIDAITAQHPETLTWPTAFTLRGKRYDKVPGGCASFYWPEGRPACAEFSVWSPTTGRISKVKVKATDKVEVHYS